MNNNPNNQHNIVSEYIVEEKDTIPQIEKKLGMSWDEIYEANKDEIEEVEILKPGTRLKIPFKSNN